MPRVAKGIGRVVRELREEAGLSVAALSRAGQIDPAALKRLENGTRIHVRFATICLLAVALGVTTDEIAYRAGLMKRKGSAQRAHSAKATVSEGLRGIESLLEQARERVDRLKRRLGQP